MKHRWKAALLAPVIVAAGFLVSPSTARGEGAPGADPQIAPPASRPRTGEADRSEFFRAAAETHLKEAELATLGEKRASTEGVERYAAKIRGDHKAALEKLKHAASRADVDLASPVLPPEARVERECLASLSGDAFDRAFMSAMIDDQVLAIQLFDAASRSGDPHTASYARETLPALKEHLAAAIDVSVRILEPVT